MNTSETQIKDGTSKQEPHKVARHTWTITTRYLQELENEQVETD